MGSGLITPNATREDADDLGDDLLVIEPLLVESHARPDHAQQELGIGMQMSDLEDAGPGTIAQHLSNLIDERGPPAFPFCLESSLPSLALIPSHEPEEEPIPSQVPDDARHGLLQSLDRIPRGICPAELLDECIETLHDDGEVEGFLVREVAVERALPNTGLRRHVLHENFVEALLREEVFRSPYDLLTTPQLGRCGCVAHLLLVGYKGGRIMELTGQSANVVDLFSSVLLDAAIAPFA